MLFNSFEFFGFFILVFALYWATGKRHHVLQNVILLIASYVFYGIAEWRMLPLLMVVTVFFYYLGIGIENNRDNKKSDYFRLIGVILGIGVLLYFKYFNFFIQSFIDLFSLLGLKSNLHTFNIIMPLGVSYFTFKLISYVIEVYRGKMSACSNICVFANYISFFPTIMSGPIDRPDKFIPQLEKERKFNYDLAMDGLQQVLWGLMKKMLIADKLAGFVTPAWENYQVLPGSTLFLSVVMYLFQLYADFSGYSDMAIGVAKLMGFRVTPNFKYPFFTTNIAELWRRWHMSLTSWVTDYVFTPLNIKFRNIGNWGLFLAILINMVIIGLWHGANWTYAVFGVYQAVLFVPLIVTGQMSKRQKLHIGKLGLPSVMDVVKMIIVFLLFAMGTVIIRADSVHHAIDYFKIMFSSSLFNRIVIPLEGVRYRVLLMRLALVGLMILIEWFQREKEFALSVPQWIQTRRWFVFIIDLSILILIALLGNDSSNAFIYFQF